jgi:uncharacterized protein (TIGR02271 family)
MAAARVGESRCADQSFYQKRGTSMPTLQDAQTWKGRTLVDRDGDKIGSIVDIYLDRSSGEPEWVAVKTGLFGSNLSFVPIEAASAAGADGELSTGEEQELYRHYGRSDYGEWDRSTDRTEATLGRDERFGHDDDADRDVSGRGSDDDAMTRSEEELDVGTQRRETGRARLRKYVVTEQEQRTVPVQREEVRVEREPITDANVDEATSGPELSEDEHEVTLHAEEPVVEKRTVPKERVRLERDTVSDEETVSEDVRKERIEGEGDARV